MRRDRTLAGGEAVRVSDLPNFSNVTELASGRGPPTTSLAENALGEVRPEKSLLMECHSEREKGIEEWGQA